MVVVVSNTGVDTHLESASSKSLRVNNYKSAASHASSSSKFDDDDEGFPHNKTINAKAMKS